MKVNHYTSANILNHISGPTWEKILKDQIAVTREKEIFVFLISDANIDAQTTNPFLYNTFSVSTDPMKLSSC